MPKTRKRSKNDVSSSSPSWFKLPGVGTMKKKGSGLTIWDARISDRLEPNGVRKEIRLNQNGMEDNCVSRDAPHWMGIKHVTQVRNKEKPTVWSEDFTADVAKPDGAISEQAPDWFRVNSVPINKRKGRATVWDSNFVDDGGVDMDSAVSKEAPNFFRVRGVPVLPKRNGTRTTIWDEEYVDVSDDDMDTAVSADAPPWFKVDGVKIMPRKMAARPLTPTGLPRRKQVPSYLGGQMLDYTGGVSYLNGQLPKNAPRRKMAKRESIRSMRSLPSVGKDKQKKKKAKKKKKKKKEEDRTGEKRRTRMAASPATAETSELVTVDDIGGWGSGTRQQRQRQDGHAKPESGRRRRKGNQEEEPEFKTLFSAVPSPTRADQGDKYYTPANLKRMGEEEDRLRDELISELRKTVALEQENIIDCMRRELHALNTIAARE